MVFWCYNHHVKNIAELCKGSTADSDSVCEGSNPSSAARKKDQLTCELVFLHNVFISGLLLSKILF